MKKNGELHHGSETGYPVLSYSFTKALQRGVQPKLVCITRCTIVVVRYKSGVQQHTLLREVVSR